MCHGKMMIVFLLMSLSAFAQEKKTVQPQAAQKPAEFFSRTGVGVGYMLFNETITISQGDTTEKGFGNYAGLFGYIDQSWSKNRWMYGGSLGAGTGKATAGGFNSLSYPDSGQRTWVMSYLEGYAYYRTYVSVMFGAGVIVGQRLADWQSETNLTLKTEDNNKKIFYAPEFLMRWYLTPRFTLVQALSSANLDGKTMWRWSTHYTF